MRGPLLALFALALTACGPTIGDACTTSADCGGSTCLNQDFAPGGYCTTTCSAGGHDCPTGSVCVRDALGKNADSCFRTCSGANDCRSGYACRSTLGSPLICVGPAGL